MLLLLLFVVSLSALALEDLPELYFCELRNVFNFVVIYPTSSSSGVGHIFYFCQSI